MNSEEHIRALSLGVTQAPNDSEEFRIAMNELLGALKASAARGHAKISEMRNALPHHPSHPLIPLPRQLKRGSAKL
jgi:hypothetical protein